MGYCGASLSERDGSHYGQTRGIDRRFKQMGFRDFIRCRRSHSESQGETQCEEEGQRKRPVTTSEPRRGRRLSTPPWRNSADDCSSRQTLSLLAPAFASGPFAQIFHCVLANPRLSKRWLAALAQKRLLHITVFCLNYLYLGRFPSLDEIGRRPNAWQLRSLAGLRSLLAVSGSDSSSFRPRPCCCHLAA